MNRNVWHSSDEGLSGVAPRTGHQYEKVESESRFFLDQTRFSGDGGRQALLDALGSHFVLKQIKSYAFDDTYFRSIDLTNPIVGSLRMRVWTRYELAGKPAEQQPVQIILSDPKTDTYRGVPFKTGEKKSKRSFDTTREALNQLQLEGYEKAFVVEKGNGVHFKIEGTGAEARVAIENVTVRNGNSSWSRTMVELEVLSGDRDTVVDAIERVLAAIGVPKESLIGEPMEKIALAGLMRGAKQ